MKDKRKQIGYRPELEYKDEYTSDINSSGSKINSNENVNKDNNETHKLITKMKKLQGLISKLPGNVSSSIEEVYDPVLDFVYDELEDSILEEVPDENEWEYVDPVFPEDDKENGKDEEDNNEGGGSGSEPFEPEDFFPIEKEEHTKEEIAEKEYIKNLVDLFDDYYYNLHSILSNIWVNLIIATNNKSKDEIAMLYNNILLNSSDIMENAKHLLDSAIRNEIIKSMKVDYYNNIFNAEETIKHLKQLKAMQELRLRYIKTEEVDGSIKTNQMNNNILIASRTAYNLKYDKAYENLYRYLHSSNQVLRDASNTWMLELRSKQILVERKGVK